MKSKQILCYGETPSVRLSMTKYQSLSRLSDFCMKFGVGVLYEKFSSMRQFLENHLSDSHT